MRNISEILKDERLKQGLTIDDVVEKTKIRKNFIVDIESGNFKSLPSESYAMGFVKNYAQFLGISEDRAAALFRREYESKKIEIMPKFKKGKSMPVRKFMLRSPKGYFVLGVLLVILFYVLFQFSFLFIGPKLALTSPKQDVIVPSHIVTVRGKTDPYAAVTVNGESVYVDLTGAFRKTVYLYTGDKKITVIAKNRSGKQTKKEIQVTVE